MITITVQAFNVFDEATEKFVTVEESTKLRMENSLYAIAEWEKKFKKPWFPPQKASEYARKQYAEERTPEETLYFVRCMIFEMNDKPIRYPDEVPEQLLYGLSEENFKMIRDYMGDSQTALDHIPETKPDKKRKPDLVKFTTDRIYAWMFETQVPMEAQYWNINRLLNVIQVVNYDNTPDDKKKNAKPYEIAQDYAKVNEMRKQALGTKG